MIDVNTSPWVQAVLKHLKDQKDLIPEATARAAGRLAYQAVQDIRAQMRVTFHNPTQWTLRGVTHLEGGLALTHPSNPGADTALVVFKETLASAKQHGAGRYLYPQVYGGARVQKRAERRLQLSNPNGQAVYLIPTRYAEYDASGNVNRGWLVAVLSAIQALGGPGFNGNRRVGRNSRRRRSVYGDRNFFVIWPGQSSRTLPGGKMLPNNLPPAIYQKFGEGKAAYIRPVFTFSRRAPVYRPIFDPVRIVRFTIERRAAEFFFRALRRQLPPAPPSGT